MQNAFPGRSPDEREGTMSLGKAIGDSMANVARTAMFTEVVQQSNSFRAHAEEVVQSWEKHSAGLEIENKNLKQRLAAAESKIQELSTQLEVKHQEAQELASVVEVRRRMEKDQLGYIRTLKKRLDATEKALKHSSAMSVALERVHNMLLAEVQRIGVTESIDLFKGNRHREEMEFVWGKFKDSGRLAIRTDQNEELRELGANIPEEACKPWQQPSAP